MRRRDVFSLCVVWGLLLAALAWALSTQFRWVQEASAPVRVQPTEKPEPPPAPAGATGVIGPVGDDTRDALAKGLGPQAPRTQEPASTTRSPGQVKGATGRRSTPSGSDSR